MEGSTCDLPAAKDHHAVAAASADDGEDSVLGTYWLSELRSRVCEDWCSSGTPSGSWGDQQTCPGWR